MRIEARKFTGKEPAVSLLQKKLQSKHIKEKVPSRPRSGIHIERKGYTANVVFSCEFDQYGKHNVFLRLSQREVFLLARLFKRDKSDAEFLAAILKDE